MQQIRSLNPALVAAVFLAAVAATPAADAPDRTWTSTDGRTFEGRLRSVTADAVEIIRSDGRGFTVPRSRLSETDIAYLDGLAEEASRNSLLKEGPYAKQIQGEWVKGQTQDGLLYQIYGSRRLKPDERYPLVIYLHGAGGRGADNEKQMEYGARIFVTEDNYEENPCFVIAPQCPADENWNGERGEEVVSFIEDLIKNLPVDRDRVYLTGYSMGASGTWSILGKHPKLIAAAAPIAGGGNPSTAKEMKKVPVWVFHGDQDVEVPVENSRRMVEALKDARGDVRYTEYPGLGHSAARPTYDDPEFHEWLFSRGVERSE